MPAGTEALELGPSEGPGGATREGNYCLIVSYLSAEHKNHLNQLLKISVKQTKYAALW